jgi:hypothetical protein
VRVVAGEVVINGEVIEAGPELGDGASGFSRWAWFGPERYSGFFARPDAQDPKGAERDARQGWATSRPDDQKRQRRSDGAWEVRTDAILPDGRRLGDALQDRPSGTFHLDRIGMKRSQSDREARLNRWLDLIDEFARVRGLRPNSERLWSELERVHGEYARNHRLPLKSSQVNELRRRRREQPGERKRAQIAGMRRRESEVMKSQLGGGDA